MGTILVWNDDWRLAGPARPLGPPGWSLVHDRWQAPLADAIVFHLPTLDPASLPRGRRPGQRWVAWSMESAVNHPRLADPAFMAPFDLALGFRRDADAWASYLPPIEELLAPPRPKTEAAPAVYFASNARDRSGRHAYVGELMRHLAVDAYGSCHRNRRLERDEGRATKLATIARYRFTLAFENAIDEDYVSEKFFDALVAGSVPVVRGAPNVGEFAPAPDAYVDANAFDGPAALAARLLALAADEEAYGRLLAWKRHGVSASFAALAARARRDCWSVLAERLAATPT